ncbi:MAG: hypothetical protein WCR06_04835 [bacterium]
MKLNRSLAVMCVWAFAVAVVAAGDRVAEIVSVNPQTGAISPTGFVATISSVAQIAVQAEALAAQADAVAIAANDASQAVSQVQSIINGLEGIGYVRGYVLSFGSGIQANTNTSATIVKFERAGSTATTSLWRAYTYFTSDPGVWPVVRFSRSLGSTNAWVTATQVSVVITNTTVGGTQYECYANTVSMPLSYTGAYFRTFADVSGAGTNQTYMPVRNGVSVNGVDPLTASFTVGTNSIRFVGGVRVQ